MLKRMDSTPKSPDNQWDGCSSASVEPDVEQSFHPVVGASVGEAHTTCG
jgi:hypothetical protein